MRWPPAGGGLWRPSATSDLTAIINSSLLPESTIDFTVGQLNIEITATVRGTDSGSVGADRCQRGRHALRHDQGGAIGRLSMTSGAQRRRSSTDLDRR